MTNKDPNIMKRQSRKKILVLGGDGFIGSYLIEVLVQKGWLVRAFDLFRDGRVKNLDHLKGKVEFFSGDFLNQSDIIRALEGVDFVFHFISMTTPASSWSDPLMDVDTNIRGTIQLLNRCVDARVKKVIFSSSGGAIYGNQKAEMLLENSETNPISPYAISKLTIEKYLEYFRINHGLEYISLRYSNPYGPRQNVIGSQGVVPIFLHRIMEKKPISVFGDGENIRDYIYIQDAIEATINIFPLKTKQHVFNVGSGVGVSINELIRIMKNVVGMPVQVEYAPKRPVDVSRVVLDSGRIIREIGTFSNISLEEGIERTWQWMKKH